MRTRAAAPEDCPALHRLLTQSWLNTWAPHMSVASVERFRSEDPVSAYLSGHLSAMTIAEQEGQVLGMAHLAGDSIAGLHVRADAQGCGVGARLMDHAEAKGGRNLEVRAFSTRAVRFYERRGWRRIRADEGDEFGTTLATIEMRLPELS